MLTLNWNNAVWVTVASPNIDRSSTIVQALGYSGSVNPFALQRNG